MPISDAIENETLLRFTYDGHPRLVEPHTYGLDRKGHPALLAFQVGGGGDSSEFVGWKMFHVAEIEALEELEEGFAGARRGFKRGDKAFIRIDSEL